MSEGFRIPKALAMLAFGGLASAVGCMCDRVPCTPEGYQWPASTGPCFGYYPTCWRPWPCECPPCPSYALPPEFNPAEFRRPPAETLVPAESAPVPTVGDVLPLPRAPLIPQSP
jgi:hypothetical protein